MTTTPLTIGVAAGADDAYCYSDNTGYNATSTVIFFRSHTSLAAYRSGAGMRFKIPSDIVASEIESAHIEVVADSAGQWRGTLYAERIPAAAWATGSPNSPWTRAQAAITAGSTGVAWSRLTNSVAGTTYASADSTGMADDIKAAMGGGGYVPGTSYVSVIFVGNNGGTEFQQVSSQEHATNNEPRLVLNITDPTPTTQTITPTAQQVVSVAGTPSTYLTDLDVSYHDGIGNSTMRTCDIFTPAGVEPAFGWPVIVFTHGGGWNGGSKSDIPAFTKADATRNGFAIIAPNYKLTATATGPDRNIGWPHPEQVKDMMCLLKWVRDHASQRRLNPNLIIMSGYSAGGHVALETALLASDPNRDTYQMAWQGDANTQGRYAAYPNMIVTEGRTNIPTVKGCFSWAGPTSPTQAYPGLINDLLDAFFGATTPNYSSSMMNRETDLDALILGLTGTVYAASPILAPDFPIGYVYDTGDTTVPTAYGYTALANALTTAGVTVASDGVVNVTGNAMSRKAHTSGRGTPGAHDNVMLDTDDVFVWDWFNAVKAKYPARGQSWPRSTPPFPTTGQGWPRQRRQGRF